MKIAPANSGIQLMKRADTIGAKFSIIIPSWNNLPYLQLCIKSIRQHSAFFHQVIVHINEGNDGTLDWVKQQTDLDYSYSVNNIGVCYALNSCRSLVATDYILYMNDDMYACPQWDKFLLDEIERINHKYFFISATAIEPTAQSSCSIQTDFGTSLASFDEQKLLATFSNIAMHDWQGATWPPNIVHKDIWDLAGGYSVEFSPGMYSDPDFSMKLWQLGVRFFKGVSKSRVYHFGSVSVKKVKKNKGYYQFINKWGITSSTLSKFYLQRGKRFDGPLEQLPIGIMTDLKNFFKRCVAAFINRN